MLMPIDYLSVYVSEIILNGKIKNEETITL